MTQVEWRQLKTAAKMGSAKAKMVEKMSRWQLVATVRSCKGGGWCHHGVGTQAGHRRSGGW